MNNEKQTSFLEELKELMKKYNATYNEATVYDNEESPCGTSWHIIANKEIVTNYDLREFYGIIE